ncbi:MAG: response regulator [Deltaproteobacteria bacterium]|nr:response regulator [Deltaproteobacteria bacterium]TLN03673.1 MAG: response regulator [bacterium]
MKDRFPRNRLLRCLQALDEKQPPARRSLMPPRSRIPLLIGLALVSLLLILLFGARIILLRSYENLEENEAHANVERVVNALKAELESIHTLAKDYAGWDDSYRFVQDGNRAFIQKNLDDPNFEHLGMNLILYLDREGKWVYARNFDLQKKLEVPFPKSLRTLLTPGSPLLKKLTPHNTCEGILTLPEGSLLVSAVPILTSEFRGPAAGTLVMGRFLNTAAIERFSLITKLQLRIHAATEPDLPLPLTSFEKEKIQVVRGADNNYLSGLSLLHDLYGNPALVVRVETPRTTYQQGIRTIRYFVVWFAGIALLIVGVSMFFARKLLLVQNKGKESHSRYQAVVEGFDGLIYIVSATRTIEFLNKKLIERLGRDATGEICHEALHEFGGICEWCDNEKVIAGETVRCEVYNPKDGSWYYVISTPVFNPDGTVSKQSMLTDITEIKRAASEKAELESQLRQAQKMEAVGQLAGGVAHDFNNILCAIIGFASLIEMSMGKNDPARPHLEQILAASDRASQLVSSLLAFSRKQVLDPHPIDMNRIVRDVQKILGRLITEDIDLLIHLSEAEVNVVVDPGQVDQVLINLVANAKDAMPSGGSLVIETGKEELPAELLKAAGAVPEVPYAVLSVRDSGTGMDSAAKEKLFEPFYTTKEVGKGTGLGLSIVYGIVKQHNGFITVDSELGKGTTFKVFFPLVRAAAGTEHTCHPRTRDLHGGETILVVEDNPAVRALNKAILETFGYRVIEALDGSDALTKFRAYQDEIQLVVMDVVMPKLNGRQAYEEISAIRPAVKVIFMSGYAADIIMEKGVVMDDVSFVTKPVKPLDFLEKVRTVLDQ